MKTNPRSICTAFAILLVTIAAANAAEPAPAAERPTLYLIGDSTVNNSANGQLGWGKPIQEMFDSTKVNVVNRAIGGRSSRTFWTEERWEKVRSELKIGDFVLIQFGHNDGGPLTEGRGRASLKGTGDETQTVTNQIGKVEVVHTYGWYIRTYVQEAKRKGATPIVLSQIPRNIWKDGKVERSTTYPVYAAEVAKAEGVPFVDLHEIVSRHYEELGQTFVQENYFGTNDHTHTLPAGAELNAASVVEGIRGLKNCPLASYLAEKKPAAAK